MRRIFYRVRRVKRYSLLIALGLFLMLAFPVYASGGSRFTLPVTITWGQGGLNEDKTYQLALKGLDEGCPMPDGSQEEYCVTLTRDKTITQLPEIRFEKPGDYHYVLTMTREDQKQIAGRRYLQVCHRAQGSGGSGTGPEAGRFRGSDRR